MCLFCRLSALFISRKRFSSKVQVAADVPSQSSTKKDKDRQQQKSSKITQFSLIQCGCKHTVNDRQDLIRKEKLASLLASFQQENQQRQLKSGKKVRDKNTDRSEKTQTRNKMSCVSNHCATGGSALTLTRHINKKRDRTEQQDFQEHQSQRSDLSVLDQCNSV